MIRLLCRDEGVAGVMEHHGASVYDREKGSTKKRFLRFCHVHIAVRSAGNCFTELYCTPR